MGDLCDQADISRFLRSPEGKAHVTQIWAALTGRQITNVHFTNHVYYVGIGIGLDDGSVFECQLPELDIEAIRDRFEEVLDREYNRDYPARRGTF